MDDFQTQAIKVLADMTGKHVSQIDKQQIAEVEVKFKKLAEIFSGSQYKNRSSYYNIKSGWTEQLYRIRNKNDYAVALTLITEILDALRGEPLMLQVYRVDKIGDTVSKITVFHGQESQVDKQYRDDKRYGYISKEIHYIKDSLIKQEITDKRFLKHYENFEKTAISRFQKQRGKRTNFNEGHIIEAFVRHLDAIKHTESYNDRLSAKHVAIMLYYSINSAPWWTGGDVGSTQIKGDNTKLATEKSIRMVANKLIQLYQNPSMFTTEEFKRMFTPKQIEEIIPSKQTLNDLLANQLKNLT